METNEKQAKQLISKKRLQRYLREWWSLLVIVSVVLAARASVADHYVVPTGSMEPTVQVADRLVVNKMAYGVRVPLTQTYLFQFADPRPGDVVVLDSPEENNVLLKRVVAGPGDWVTVRNGKVECNGQLFAVTTAGKTIQENIQGRSHSIRLSYGGGPDLGPEQIPPGKYLVMGDNRGESHDGRSFGWIDREAILGQAVAIYFSNGALAWKAL